MLHTSGLTAFGTVAQQGDICQQVNAIFEQLKEICRQQNTCLDNLIKVTIFVTDYSDMESLRNTLFSVYQGDVPASSLVKVDALFSEDLKVDIEAIIAV